MMTPDMSSTDERTLPEELVAAVDSLEASLQQAGQALSAIRSLLPQIAAVSAVMGEMEATMARARRQLTGSGEPPAQVSPSLRELRSVVSQPPVEEAPGVPVVEEEPVEAPTLGQPRCLLLEVRTKEGSLDLKAVDGSVSGHDAVVDIALLDYDGRRAALKIWISDDTDPMAVRNELIESLQHHFADDRDVEITIDLAEDQAA